MTAIGTEFFAAGSKIDRAHFQGEYLDFLGGPEGVGEVGCSGLTARELFLGEIEAEIRYQGRRAAPLVAPEVFSRNLRRRRPEPGLDRATLWALCVAKLWCAEHHAVEFERTRRKDLGGPPVDIYARILRQERSHPRALGAALLAIGLPMSVPPPQRVTGLALATIVALPRPLSAFVTCLGELLGVVLLQRLLAEARELFAEDRLVTARLASLLGPVIDDEIGHVRFFRSLLGPRRLSLVRVLIPHLVPILLSDIPEADLLFGRDRLCAAMGAPDQDLKVGSWASSRAPAPTSGPGHRSSGCRPGRALPAPRPLHPSQPSQGS